jgi:hypothetical protein
LFGILADSEFNITNYDETMFALIAAFLFVAEISGLNIFLMNWYYQNMERY